jgi:hypothetical protein
VVGILGPERPEGVHKRLSPIQRAAGAQWMLFQVSVICGGCNLRVNNSSNQSRIHVSCYKQAEFPTMLNCTRNCGLL